jgi:hypothetical protein
MAHGRLHGVHDDTAYLSVQGHMWVDLRPKIYTSLNICGQKQTTACSLEITGRGILWFATFHLTAISICGDLFLRSLHNAINDLIVVWEFAFTAHFLT